MFYICKRAQYVYQISLVITEIRDMQGGELRHAHQLITVNILRVKRKLSTTRQENELHLRFQYRRRKGGGGGGGDGPPIIREGGQHTLWPPKNPPTFSFNFYVKKSQSTKLKGKIIINVTLINLKVHVKLFLSILFLNFLYYQILR